MSAARHNSDPYITRHTGRVSCAITPIMVFGALALWRVCLLRWHGNKRRCQVWEQNPTSVPTQCSTPPAQSVLLTSHVEDLRLASCTALCNVTPHLRILICWLKSSTHRSPAGGSSLELATLYSCRLVILNYNNNLLYLFLALSKPGQQCKMCYFQCRRISSRDSLCTNISMLL